jgi:hypothetical protein
MSILLSIFPPGYPWDGASTRFLEQAKAKLMKIRPERGPAEDHREAIDINLRHLDDHGRSLWGHVAATAWRAVRGLTGSPRTCSGAV